MITISDWTQQRGIGRARRTAKPTAPPPPDIAPFVCNDPGIADADALARHACAWFRDQMPANAPLPVVGTGDPHADLCIIGKAPSDAECRDNLPFVGPSGTLLHDSLRHHGLAASPGGRVWLTNASFWHAPSGLDPHDDAVRASIPVLAGVIARMQPRIILAFGRIAGRVATGSAHSVARLRRKPHAPSADLVPGEPAQQVRVHVTWHPAFLLREAGYRRQFHEDLQTVADALGPAPAAGPADTAENAGR